MTPKSLMGPETPIEGRLEAPRPEWIQSSQEEKEKAESGQMKRGKESPRSDRQVMSPNSSPRSAAWKIGTFGGPVTSPTTAGDGETSTKKMRETVEKDHKVDENLMQEIKKAYLDFYRDFKKTAQEELN